MCDKLNATVEGVAAAILGCIYNHHGTEPKKNLKDSQLDVFYSKDEGNLNQINFIMIYKYVYGVKNTSIFFIFN
jgi:hypothetical protein